MRIAIRKKTEVSNFLKAFRLEQENACLLMILFLFFYMFDQQKIKSYSASSLASSFLSCHSFTYMLLEGLKF